MDETPQLRGCAISCPARRANASHCKRTSHFREICNALCCNFFEKVTGAQAPVNQTELNLCLVGKPHTISRLRQWAQRHFEIPADQPWRSITPLTRAPVPCAHENLLFIGDAARVVEPFTGEGIYYALRSGELAANAIAKIISGKDRQEALREFAHASLRKCTGEDFGSIGWRALQVYPLASVLSLSVQRKLTPQS